MRTSQLFINLAIHSTQLSLVIEQYKIPPYLGSKPTLHTILLRSAGIGRPPHFRNRKLQKEHVWWNHYISGAPWAAYGVGHTSPPNYTPVPMREKLTGYSVFLMKNYLEPTLDYAHTVVPPISFTQSLARN